MSENITKQQNRIMGEYSISKSFKGILRIANIIDLIKNEEDIFFNPAYYGKPSKLLNISGGALQSQQIGWNTPSKGMDGSIDRYSNNNDLIKDDDLKVGRVPMTDSMGNYLNWNIGYTGVTIGSDENINGSSVELETFKQNDIIQSDLITKKNNLVLQQKYFPVLESGNIIIGLNNKEHPADKYKINKDSSLIIENRNNIGKLIIENQYDKSNPSSFTSKGKTFVQYSKEPQTKFRTIYTDDKSNVEEYDVFMYRQDNYDYFNHNYELSDISEQDKNFRGNDILLNNFNFDSNTNKFIPKEKQVDSIVGIVNLKEYVSKIINKFLKSSLVEVPTGTIINQFCSLDKWYAAPDNGIDDLICADPEDNDDSFSQNASFPGHRPAMMNKRDIGMFPKDESENNSIQSNLCKVISPESTILGACKKINKLINPNYNFSNKETDTSEEEQQLQKDLGFSPEGFYKEIIPLYKRDYVLCDGSIYAIWLFPKNFISSIYPNRRETFERFLDLFFAIGYQYTTSPNYVNKRFDFEWFNGNDEILPSYKILRLSSSNNKENGEHLVTHKNCQNFKDEEGNPKDGYPKLNAPPEYLLTDRHALFVEDFLTILAFEKIWELYNQADQKGMYYTHEKFNEVISKTEIPEKYRLNTFIGDSVDDIKGFINRTSLTIDNNFIMELPYFNFQKDGNEAVNDVDISKMPLIKLGREVRTFGDPIKFWDEKEKKWAIVEAYKIPQIQYIIDLFTVYSTVDTVAPILNLFYQYNFQVPNLCGNLPTFMGSSGVIWADSQFRRLREIESWSSNYAQMNYQHRHFVFVEPGNSNPNEEYQELVNKPQPHKGVLDNSKLPAYSGGTNITKNSYVASANWWGGKVLCETGESRQRSSYTYETGKGGHINYIWNELGAGDDKLSNITIENDSTVYNGMRFPIFQNSSLGKYSWTTGNYRKNRTVDKSSTEIKISSNYNDQNVTLPDGSVINMADTWWDKDFIDVGAEICQKKTDYESNTGWYGWELAEDPRFDSFEPNRGRTSTSIDIKFDENSISNKRYNINKGDFNITLNENIIDAEWFSPENVKMLPLIKL